MPTRRPSDNRVAAQLRRPFLWIAPVLRTKHFWLGLVLAVGGLAALYLAFNHVVMPTYTRQNSEVVVPEVMHMPVEEAVGLIEGRRLRAEIREQPFNPGFARNVILDQNPSANASVKPGRRVYMYVNSGTERTVSMPEVRTLTESVAKSELSELGLTQVEIHVDDNPSPYLGTVTRQEPESGVSVRTSESVQLWVSPGLDDRTVEVPDVRGLAHREALVDLRAAGLWVDPTRVVSGTITSQEPVAGSLVRVGTEVRLSSAPIQDDDVTDPMYLEEFEEGIPPFIEVPPGEEIPDLDTPPRPPEEPRDPDRIDW